MQYNTQREAVLDHLNRYGSITSLEAIKLYGATRLSGLIYSLRHQGYGIKTEIIRVDTKYGRKANIAKYILHEKV